MLTTDALIGSEIVTGLRRFDAPYCEMVATICTGWRLPFSGRQSRAIARPMLSLLMNWPVIFHTHFTSESFSKLAIKRHGDGRALGGINHRLGWSVHHLQLSAANFLRSRDERKFSQEGLHLRRAWTGPTPSRVERILSPENNVREHLGLRTWRPGEQVNGRGRAPEFYRVKGQARNWAGGPCPSRRHPPQYPPARPMSFPKKSIHGRLS